LSDKKTLLEVKDLKKYFTMKGGLLQRQKSYLKAVDGLNFEIKQGETFGLVGESGCGKSTTGRTVLRLYEPTGGSIMFDGKDLAPMSPKELKPYRKRIQMIFQDPYASLNGRMTVNDIIGEGITVHQIFEGKEKQDRIYDLLQQVGLKKDHANRYPHEFSGGQRQRIGIAPGPGGGTRAYCLR
jgi:oligopeptide transport system ATP-binding protein